MADPLRSRRTLALLKTAAIAAIACDSGAAHASFLSGDALDSVANVMAWVVLVMVPLIGIAVFWMIHVLPEKIAHKRHHPQRQAIQTLCLLSLVFGGLLWPIAWLWAYTRPIGYKLAYGTDKHEDYFQEAAGKARAGELVSNELVQLREELDAMQARNALSPELSKLRDDIIAIQQPAAAAKSPPAKVAAMERGSD